MAKSLAGRLAEVHEPTGSPRCCRRSPSRTCPGSSRRSARGSRRPRPPRCPRSGRRRPRGPGRRAASCRSRRRCPATGSARATTARPGTARRTPLETSRTYDYYRDTLPRLRQQRGRAVASCTSARRPARTFADAYWNGDQMVFGEGYAAPLDVTADELTHAITDRTADLVYQCQSGPLNESFSDISASNVDTDDWEIGEDLPDGPRSATWPTRAASATRPTSTTTTRRPTTATRPTTTARWHSNSGSQPRLLPDRAEHRPQGRGAGHVPRAHGGARAGLELRGLPHRVVEGGPGPVGEGSPQVAQIDQSFAAVGLDGTWEARR